VCSAWQNTRAILLGIVLFLSAGVGSAANSAEDHCLAFVLEG
jgi:hypothetical protein